MGTLRSDLIVRCQLIREQRRGNEYPFNELHNRLVDPFLEELLIHFRIFQTVYKLPIRKVFDQKERVGLILRALIFR